MATPIRGLHHVTATVDDAQADLDFAAGILRLRLVKRTVNFDNHHVFHFYYGDRVGTPGTIWTTFPYKGYGVRTGRHGAGQFTATSFSVPTDSLGFWTQQLAEHGLDVVEHKPRFGEGVIACVDPSGLAIELIGTSSDARTPWLPAGIDAGAAIRGIHSVTASVRALAPTRDFVSNVLGLTEVGREGHRTRFSIGTSGPGHTLDVVEAADSASGVNGLGTVHHVALAVTTPTEQLEMRERLLSHGVQVTPVLDRQYFQSIYFREPGGVLFEIATSSPGFEVDETADALGTGLKLPSWEEPHRTIIEAGLPAIRVAGHR